MRKITLAKESYVKIESSVKNEQEIESTEVTGLKTTDSEVQNWGKELILPATFTREKVPSDLDAVATREETEL